MKTKTILFAAFLVLGIEEVCLPPAHARRVQGVSLTKEEIIVEKIGTATIFKKRNEIK